ncbi:MAG: hypothetical protein SFY66_15970 [Oculatellaceae cyanobacterium bins.114]|nr:hypothetical protein [Oculatellaceae cyanobacterium bins.114]
MSKKLLQAVVITFALYFLMGMQSQQSTSTSQSLSTRSLSVARVIHVVKSLL